MSLADKMVQQINAQELLDLVTSELQPKIVIWGGGAIIDKDGNEIGRFTVEPTGLSLEEQVRYQELRASVDSPSDT